MTKVMIFKHEDTVEGVAIGPLIEGTLDERGFPVLGGEPRPFDPNRPPDPWYTLTDARRIARKFGLALYET